MTDLSPAAKAVMDAYDNSSWDYETGEFEAVAAVLRAAADYLNHPTSAHTLYAIADELDAIK